MFDSERNRGSGVVFAFVESAQDLHEFRMRAA